MMTENSTILSVNDLRISFRTVNGVVQAVRGVSFDLKRGETVAIVGESGSGKSVTMKALMGILPPNAVIEEGDTVANDILFKVIGKNGRKLSLPIDISIIKEYCFSTELKEDQFYDALMWIILRYIAISRCISWNKWLKEYEKNKDLENSSSN